MKLTVSPRTRALLWDAHAWVGALASVVLFAAFFLGAFALYWQDLGAWQEPRRRGGEAISVDRALELAGPEIDRAMADRSGWFGVFLPTGSEPWAKTWSFPESGDRLRWLDPRTGRAQTPESELGQLLYDMHFLGVVPGGVPLAGVASLALIFLIATGLVMQLGKIRRELLQFRPARALRTLWSDAHKVTGVVLLPFLFVFAWSGAVMCLSYDWLRPVTTHLVHGGDAGAAARSEGYREVPDRRGASRERPDFARAVAQARERFPAARIERVKLLNAGAANAVIEVDLMDVAGIYPHVIVRTTPAGDVAWTRPAGGSTAYSRAMSVLYGLHFATFAGPALRVLYALLALLGAFSILTGNLVWIERRRSTGLSHWDVFLGRLTSGGCAGLCFAVAALFFANQVLPRSLADRPTWEHVAFFVAWGGAAVFALARPSACASTGRLLDASAALVLLTLACDFALRPRLPFASGATSAAGVELALVLLASLALVASRAAATVERAGGGGAEIAAPERRAVATT